MTVATTMGKRPRISRGFGAGDLGWLRGNQPRTVQQVVAARNEQAASGRGAAKEDWAPAHPQRSAMLSSASGVGIVGMGLSSCMYGA